jgi:hypothetical protein
MTLGDIYNRAMWIVYGDSTPPTSTATNMQAVPDGVVANLHREIQEDTSYWFMEANYGVEIPAYTRVMALPSDYKDEISPLRVLTFSDDNYDALPFDGGSAACSGTTAVTGTDTAWSTDWTGQGYALSWDGITWYTISTVVSATSITLSSAGPTIDDDCIIRYPDIASCSAGTAVTGTNSAWDTDWTGKKHQITWDEVTWYTILTVESATSLTLESAGPTASGAYMIRKCCGQVALTKVKRGGADEQGYDLGGTSDHPLFYDIYDNVIRLYPMPEEDCYLTMKYFKYFPRPSTFNAHTDSVTEHAAEVLIYMIAAIEERRRKEYGAAEEYDKQVGIKLNMLLSKHNQRTSANYVLPYIDS